MHLRSLMLCFFLIFNVSSASQSRFSDDFKLRDVWNHSSHISCGRFYDAVIDGDNDLLLMSFKDGMRIINKNEIKNIAEFGQGPGEIESCFAMSLDEGRLVVFESPGKMMFYSKKNKVYSYVSTKWLKNKSSPPIMKGATSYKDKVYISGFYPDMRNKERMMGFMLGIYENGELKDNLIYKDFGGIYRGPTLLHSFVKVVNDQIWVILESEPIIYIVDYHGNKILETIHLPMPKNYVPIKDYLPWKTGSLSSVIKQFEEWICSYSRIENVLVDDKVVMVQTRSPNDPGARFQICCFDINTFELKSLWPCDHLLLGGKNGVLYFFENGNPGLDENTDKTKILLYSKNAK